MFAEIAVFSAVCLALASASLSDVRSREVPDWHWIALCILASASALLGNGIPAGILTAGGYALVAAFMFCERVTGIWSVIAIASASAMLFSASLLSGDPAPSLVVVMTLSLVAMYMSGALKGGADVKALVSLCMLYPVYPGFGGSVWVPVYPAAYVFNPVFSTLLIALVLSFAFLIPVIARGRKVSATYETEISDARRRHVWPVEDIQGGLRVPVRPQDDPGDVYSRLEEAGYDRVRVTPMVPFVLPITAAFIITILAGSPLFGLLEICLYS